MSAITLLISTFATSVIFPVVASMMLYICGHLEASARQAMEKFEFKPTNLMISLLNEDHLPIYNWYVVNAVPKRLEIGGINAMSGEIVVETLALNYQYFKYYDPASIALDAAASLSASVSVSI